MADIVFNDVNHVKIDRMVLVGRKNGADALPYHSPDALAEDKDIESNSLRFLQKQPKRKFPGVSMLLSLLAGWHIDTLGN